MENEVYAALKAALKELVDEEGSLSQFLLSVRKAHKSGYITMDELIDLYTLAGKYID